jgi:hypothetical protein
MLDLNLLLGHSSWLRFLSFFLVPPSKFQNRTLIRPCTLHSKPFQFMSSYCHVLPGNTTNNLLWVLNLITIYLDFNNYNQSYSLHKFTTHKLHSRTFCSASSSVSTELVWPFTVSICFLSVSLRESFADQRGNTFLRGLVYLFTQTPPLTRNVYLLLRE